MTEIHYHLQGNAPQQFDQKNVPRILRPHAEAMFGQISLHAGDRVLDLACGTGIVTRVAVERYQNLASIVGLDFSAGMIEVARENTPQTDTPITWQQGDMCDLPFPDNSFDVVLSQQGLQFAPDRLTALRHIRRVLVPGGRLAFTVWSEAYPIVAETMHAVRRHVGNDAAADILVAYSWTDADHIRTLVAEAGFHSIGMQRIESRMQWPASLDDVAEFLVHAAARSPNSPYASALIAAHAVMVEEVYGALQPYLEGDDFVMPGRSHLVQARTA
jgi:ubiquinone/menaquinone biosynthesis C-methylase UbiE